MMDQRLTRLLDICRSALDGGIPLADVKEIENEKETIYGDIFESIENSRQVVMADYAETKLRNLLSFIDMSLDENKREGYSSEKIYDNAYHFAHIVDGELLKISLNGKAKRS